MKPVAGTIWLATRLLSSGSGSAPGDKSRRTGRFSFSSEICFRFHDGGVRFRTPVIMHNVSNYSASAFCEKAAVYRVVELPIWIEQYEDVPDAGLE